MNPSALFVDPPTLHLSLPHPCGYLPDLQAATMFVDSTWPVDPHLYEWLLERGFRRSGSHVYRPCCPDCTACLPVRLPVQRFHPQRSLRRVQEKNRDLSVSVHPARYNDERFALYLDYLQTRHASGPMAAAEPHDFTEFLLCDWGETRFVEFRLGQRLLAVAVMDVLPGSLSAVYTFFDPRQHQRSLGSVAVLWQVQHAIQQQLPNLYLGYWIKNCRKMAYKARFQPMEGYSRQQWSFSTL
ncbi:MAG: Arginyltransferase [Magnetococcales bacterium]|nr:Arginyltransferase [Magnetococcales bacterium]HIJ84489.1 arginyltransferase [Magnetococcales bacterium]